MEGQQGQPSSSCGSAKCTHNPLQVTVVYLFAGKRRHSDIASFVRKAESEGVIVLDLIEYDIERSPQHDLRSDSLWDKIFAKLKSTPCFLFVSPPCNTFSRARFQKRYPGPRPLRTRLWPRGFLWLSKKNKAAVEEANQFVDRCIEACGIAWEHGGAFGGEHPEDLGVVDGEHPGSIWQWESVLALIARAAASCVAIHQCAFGAITPKPTRLVFSCKITDPRCYHSMPWFDSAGHYRGPLPRDCGHKRTHKLIGKTAHKWNTSPSAAYPPGMCSWISDMILTACAAFGGGDKNHKLRAPASEQDGTTTKRKKRLPKPVLPPRSTEQVHQQSVDGTEQVQHYAVQQPDPPPDDDECDFDMGACRNVGRPIQVEWDGKTREFTDGFGLCSPTRWPPKSRGKRRASQMQALCESIYGLLEQVARTTIHDPRREACRLVTGNTKHSPFSEDVLSYARRKWASLLDDPASATVIDSGQPFLLRGLSQWLKVLQDPDTDCLVDDVDSFATGVFVGVDKPLPRTPQVFPRKDEHRKLGETEFNPFAINYPSAQIIASELEEKFREEEALGRMVPTKQGVALEKYGDKLRIAAMAAIVKPDGAVRPLHDGTHSVMVNHSITYQDKLQLPGPAEVASSVREAGESGEAPFCVSADIKAAHRLVKIREDDWGYLGCKSHSDSDVVWLNKTGTFGISSAPYWRAKLFALVGRFVGYMFGNRWMLQMAFVDDLHGVFTGQLKFIHLWVWILAYELVGTPFGYHKFKGGFSSEFVGFHLRYDQKQVGIADKRGAWLVAWIDEAASKKFVVATRDFAEFLGRLGFVSQVITWLKPHLAPLYAWSAVCARGTVGKLPETVIITLQYIGMELKEKRYMVSALRPVRFDSEMFRTDAKCTDNAVVLGGWELSTGRWFALELDRNDVPYLFKPDNGGSQWASTSAELLSSLVALHVFGWLDPKVERAVLPMAISGGADNRANEALTQKRSTTKWPLLLINMELSSALAASRLPLTLKWWPREENTWADALTNLDFSNFDPAKRIAVEFKQFDFKIIEALWKTKEEFEQQKAKAKLLSLPQKKKNRAEKTPW